MASPPAPQSGPTAAAVEKHRPGPTGIGKVVTGRRPVTQPQAAGGGEGAGEGWREADVYLPVVLGACEEHGGGGGEGGGTGGGGGNAALPSPGSSPPLPANGPATRRRLPTPFALLPPAPLFHWTALPAV